MAVFFLFATPVKGSKHYYNIYNSGFRPHYTQTITNRMRRAHNRKGYRVRRKKVDHSYLDTENDERELLL